MDLSKLIEFYDKEQKTLFTSFCITLPLVYTILYLNTSSFKGFDLFVQVVFSMSASICAVTISFTSLLVSVMVSNIKRSIRLFHVVLPQILTTIVYCCFPDILGYGILGAVILFLVTSQASIFSYFIIFRVLNFTEIEEHKEKKLEK